MSCAVAEAGLVRGPSMLKIVRRPISRRGPMAYFMAPCSFGAKRNPMPTCWTHSSTISGGASMLTPMASSTSALPQPLETARLPCLATVRPVAATTKAAVVEMLKVLRPSPPVPQVSTMTGERASMRVALRRMTRAAPVTSAMVSPFMRRAVMNAPIWAGVAFPSMISVMVSVISASCRSIPWTTLASASRIMMLFSFPVPGDHLQEVSQNSFPVRRQDRLGVKLHALEGIVAVAKPHDFAFFRFCAHLEEGRERIPLHEQRVVSPRRERVGQALEDGPAVVEDGRGLAVHESLRADDLGAEGV